MNVRYWKFNEPLMSVGWSVCHYFLKGREITLPCSYWSTCYQTDARVKEGRSFREQCRKAFEEKNVTYPNSICALLTN